MWPAACQFFFWKDVHFMDHFEDSPWICKVVWEIWIISHLFFEISCFVVFFAVSHCRLFLKRFSLAISILLLLVWGEPREKSLDPRDPNLFQRWRERDWEESTDVWITDILVKGKERDKRLRPRSVFYLHEQLCPLGDGNRSWNLFCQLPLK